MPGARGRFCARSRRLSEFTVKPPKIDCCCPIRRWRCSLSMASTFSIETLRASEAGTITLCALGPLTNIAMALAKAPEVAGKIRELVVMGGACFELGNVTPAAEFNMHVDPHAAAIVFDSGIPITMIPLDVTHQLVSTEPRLAALRALPNRCGAAVAGLLASVREKPPPQIRLARPGAPRSCRYRIPAAPGPLSRVARSMSRSRRRAR